MKKIKKETVQKVQKYLDEIKQLNENCFHLKTDLNCQENLDTIGGYARRFLEDDRGKELKDLVRKICSKQLSADEYKQKLDEITEKCKVFVECEKRNIKMNLNRLDSWATDIQSCISSKDLSIFRDNAMNLISKSPEVPKILKKQKEFLISIIEMFCTGEIDKKEAQQSIVILKEDFKDAIELL